MLDIRLAHPDDAEAIHLILQETWGASLLFDVFIDNISLPEHQVFVAVEADAIAGFLSAFLVPKPTPRWEIDLIIVRHRSQGKGIGTFLIQEALTYGSNLGAHGAKASIRIDNYASQAAFSKAGFATDAQVLSLFCWEPLACKSVANVANGVYLIPVDTLIYRGVDTLIYRGLWIEGFVASQLSSEEQHNVVRAAQCCAFNENRLNTGMFIPSHLKETIAPNLLTTATNFGQYHRWQYVFNPQLSHISPR